MNNLIIALVKLHFITRFEAYCTVKQIMKEVDEGFNPIELLKEMGLNDSYQWDLQKCYCNY